MGSHPTPDDPTVQAHAAALAKTVFAARRWSLLDNGGASYHALDEAWDLYMALADAADEAGRLCSICGPSFRED